MTPDVLLPEQEEKESEEEPKVENSSFVNESEVYKKMGFYCAVNTCGNANELDRLVYNNSTETLVSIKDIQERFKRRFVWFEQQLEDMKGLLAQERSNKDTHQRLENIRADLLAAFQELGKEKRNLIERRLDEFSDEFKKLLETQDKLYDDWRALNLKAFKDNQPGLEVTKKRAEQLRDQLNKRYGEVEDQLDALDKGGANLPVFKTLLGNGMALAAGWFFSVFLMYANGFGNGLGQQDIWFFLIQSILSALSTNPFIALGQIVLPIILVAGCAYWCNRLLKRFSPDQNREDILINLTREEDPGMEESSNSARRAFSLQIKSDSFFAFWLHVAPILLGLGLVFIALKMGSAPQYVNQLDVSIAGQLIGTAIAYAVGSMIYIFLSKVKDVRRLLWINYVVAGLALLSPLIFLWLDKTLQISITGFVYSVMLASFPLAFGMRYRGLTQIAHEMNQAIAVCSDFIRKYSAPIPVGLFSNRFHIKIKHMQESILDWIDGRNHDVRQMQDAPVYAEREQQKVNFAKRLIKQFSRIFRKKENEATGSDPGSKSNTTPTGEIEVEKPWKTNKLELDAFEKQNFPDYDKQILALQFAYEEIDIQNKAVNTRIEKLQKDIEETIGKVFGLRRDQSKTIKQAEGQGKLREIWLREGFELGLWHLKFSILPDRDCPPLRADIPIWPPNNGIGVHQDPPDEDPEGLMDQPAEISEQEPDDTQQDINTDDNPTHET